MEGIYPDAMHLVDLSITPDLTISLLLDWSDDSTYIQQPTRQKRLDHLAGVYRQWVGNESDRANRKLFTTEVLKPGANAFASISQHYLSAAAARGFLVFLCKVAEQFAQTNGAPVDLWMGRIAYFLCLVVLVREVAKNIRIPSRYIFQPIR